MVGEAVVRLGQIPHERTLGALLARLREVEAGIAAGGLPALGLEDLERLRALIAVQLLRGGAPAARRAVVQGALRRLREAGDADRLVELRGFDLSAEPELVDELLEALREASKVLAAFDAPPPAGARTEAPAGAAPAAPPVQRMEGDLQLFGLPNLLQSGAPAAACEEALAADAFRVRTLLAHWLAEGAVEVSQFDAAPLSPPPPPTA